MISKKLITELEDLLKKMPVVWDGRKAILEMRDAGYAHWKQMEWIGFYFQFLCDTKLIPLLKIPGPTDPHKSPLIYSFLMLRFTHEHTTPQPSSFPRGA